MDYDYDDGPSAQRQTSPREDERAVSSSCCFVMKLIMSIYLALLRISLVEHTYFQHCLAIFEFNCLLPRLRMNRILARRHICV